MLSAQDAINLAEVRVDVPENYNRETGQTVPHGPLDLRMGQSLRDTQCATCGRQHECPGHFGYIPL